MPLRAQPPQGCASANFATSANLGDVAIPSFYFFGAAGAVGAAGGAVTGAAGTDVDFVVCRCSTVAPPDPLFFVAMIDSEIDVSMNTTVEMVVAFESSVAEPRGPKAVCEPIPPKAPARSAAFPLCKRITMIKKKHTITCTIVSRTAITTSIV